MNEVPASSGQEQTTLSGSRGRLLQVLRAREQDAQRIPAYPRPAKSQSVRFASSYSQQRLWFIDQLQGGHAAYHIPLTLRLRGALDARALERAIDGVIAVTKRFGQRSSP